MLKVTTLQLKSYKYHLINRSISFVHSIENIFEINHDDRMVMIFSQIFENEFDKQKIRGHSYNEWFNKNRTVENF